MKHTSKSAWVFGSVGIALAFLWLSMERIGVAAGPMDVSTGRITGTVADADGRPLAQASVTLRTDTPRMQATVMTGKAGASSVDLGPGTYTVAVDLKYAPNPGAKGAKAEMFNDNSIVNSLK